MKLVNKIKITKAIIFYHLFRTKKPIYVDIKLTNRCNLNCQYCISTKFKNQELTKKEIFSLLTTLKKIGTIVVNFSGGEVLLRDDIDEIVNFSIKKRLNVIVKTNGILIPDKIDQLKNVSKIKLSLDGPEKIHNSLRGVNSFKKLINAVRICKKHKIPIGFNTTISKVNIAYVEFILKTAKKYGAKVDFSPLLSTSHNKKLMPSEEEFKLFFKSLSQNKKYRKYIANSKQNLKSLFDYSGKRKIKCYAGKLCCRVNSDGKLHICPIVSDKHSDLSIRNSNFKSIFLKLPQIECKKYFSCWIHKI